MILLTALALVSTTDFASVLAIPTTELATVPESTAAVELFTQTAPVPSKLGFSYTYIEANYTWFDSDAAGSTLDGFELTGSFELPMNFFAQLGVSGLNGDIDLKEYRLGAGWHFPLSDTLDAYGVLSWLDQNYNNGVSDENGPAADVGVRLMLDPKIEVGGYGEWADLDNSDFGLGATGRYYFTEELSAGARVLFIDSGNEWAAGLRFQF